MIHLPISIFTAEYNKTAVNIKIPTIKISNLQILSIEWQGTTDQSVQYDAQTPHVNFWTIIFLSWNSRNTSSKAKIN